MDSTGQEITVNVKLEREDAGEMNTAYLKALQRRRWSWHRFVIAGIVVLFFILLLFVLHLFTGSASSDFNSLFTAVICLAFVYVILYVIYKLGMPVLAGRSGRRQFDTNKILQKETQYTITSDGLAYLSEAGRPMLRLQEIYKIMETVKYLFIYESDQEARIIPKRCFATENDLREAVRLLKDNMPAKKYEVYKF